MKILTSAEKVQIIKPEVDFVFVTILWIKLMQIFDETLFPVHDNHNLQMIKYWSQEKQYQILLKLLGIWAGILGDSIIWFDNLNGDNLAISRNHAIPAIRRLDSGVDFRRDGFHQTEWFYKTTTNHNITIQDKFQQKATVRGIRKSLPRIDWPT